MISREIVINMRCRFLSDTLKCWSSWGTVKNYDSMNCTLTYN